MTTKTFSAASKLFAADLSNRDEVEGIVRSVRGDIGPAWDRFARSHNLIPMKFIVDLAYNKGNYGIYIEALSKSYKSKDKYINKIFNSFMQSLDMVASDYKIVYPQSTPYILCSVNVTWWYVKGGMSEYVPIIGGDDKGRVIYDINDARWYTLKEYARSHPELKGII